MSWRPQFSNFMMPPVGVFPVGALWYGQERVRQINSSGSLSLDGTTVENDVVFNGSFTAKSASIEGQLDVKGAAYVEGTTIYHMTSICGYLDAINSVFKNLVTITAEKADFSACTVEASLLIKPTDRPFDKQMIYLRDKTIVNGSITFTAGCGEVILSGDSVVHGQIIGGIQRIEH